MRSKHKALLLVLCVVLLVSATAFGTLAYLTDTEAVTNTFTVGQVGLKLDEAKVNEDGEPINDNGTVVELEEAPRVQGNAYHLLPGHTYVKDPTVTMDAKNEDAYVRLIVNVKSIDQLKAALPNSGATAKYYGTDGTFLLQMLCNGWDGNTWVYKTYNETTENNITTGTYEFRYKEIVTGQATEKKLDALFDSITVPGEIDGAHLAHLAGIEINVVAHAIQADGFADADAAWAAFAPTT